MSKFITIEKAFQMVYELAENNLLQIEQCANEPELKEEAEEQRLALDTFHDFVINNETKYITKKR